MKICKQEKYKNLDFEIIIEITEETFGNQTAKLEFSVEPKLIKNQIIYKDQFHPIDEKYINKAYSTFLKDCQDYWDTCHKVSNIALGIKGFTQYYE